MHGFPRRKLIFLAALFVCMCGATSAPAVSLFLDDFNGPDLNPVWQPSLPDDAPLGKGYVHGPVTYIGAPGFTFETLDSNSVIRLSNTLNDMQRIGWSTSETFTVPDFRYEVRFNTLDQSAATSIDAFIEIWLIDAVDQNRFDMVSPFGSSYSADLRFFAGSSIDNNYTNLSFNYQNDTWYRLVLEGTSVQNVRASLLDDNGTELIGQTLWHTATAFPSGFRIGLSQAMGTPGEGYYPVDVAADFAQVTSTIPEPSSLVLLATGILGVIIGYRWRRHSIRRKKLPSPKQGEE